MKQIKNNILFGIIFSILYVISVFFFYYMSLENGDNSSHHSGFVTDIVINIILIFKKNWIVDYSLIHNFVRKFIGHFCYSGLIGVLGFCSWYFLRLKVRESMIINLMIGILIAGVGEILQLIPNDRGPSFGDFLINYMGYISGVIIILLIVQLIIKKNNRGLYV